MALRTTKSSVTFAAPFKLPEFVEAQPAGTYDVLTDEEIVEGNDRTVYFRVATFLYVTHGDTTSMVTVDPKGLQAALERDQEL